MLNDISLSKEQVIARQGELPSLPSILNYILNTLADENFSINDLERHLAHDPTLIGKIFSHSSRAIVGVHHSREINDIHTALSILGTSRLREIIIQSSLASFFEKTRALHVQLEFSRHSLATGISAQQIAIFSPIVDCSPSTALVAGTMHDIGQLWLYRFMPDIYQELRNESIATSKPSHMLERQKFGVDHAVIGAWLAESWLLPKEVCDAIRYHHTPDEAIHEPLVPLVHVAEVLSNALNLTNSDYAHVSYLSTKSCQKLGLNWDEKTYDLFGMIEVSVRRSMLEVTESIVSGDSSHRQLSSCENLSSI